MNTFKSNSRIQNLRLSRLKFVSGVSNQTSSGNFIDSESQVHTMNLHYSSSITLSNS